MQRQHFRNKYKKKSMAYHRHTIGTYKPPSQSDSLFSENLSSNLSTYLKDYHNTFRSSNFIEITLRHGCPPVNFEKCFEKKQVGRSWGGEGALIRDLRVNHSLIY